MKKGYRMKTYTKADGSTGKVPVKIGKKKGAKKSTRKKGGAKRASSGGSKGLASRVSKLETRMTKTERKVSKLETFAAGISSVVGRRYAKSK